MVDITDLFFIFACVCGAYISQVALQNKIKLPDCLNFIKEARAQGLTIPVVLMGALSLPIEKSIHAL